MERVSERVAALAMRPGELRVVDLTVVQMEEQVVDQTMKQVEEQVEEPVEE